MQPDDPELDVNTKPIWDITLKLGEFFLVAFNVFFTEMPWVCCSLNLVVNTAFLLISGVPFTGEWLSCLKATHSPHPISSSNFINKLSSFMLFAGWWSTFCSLMVLGFFSDPPIVACAGTATDRIAVPSCVLAFERSRQQGCTGQPGQPGQGNCNPGVCPAGCTSTPKKDLTPLMMLLVGVMVIALAHLVWYAESTSDRGVAKRRKQNVVKQWMSLQHGNDSAHAVAVKKKDENANKFGGLLLARMRMRYHLFPDHGHAAAAHVKESLGLVKPGRSRGSGSDDSGSDSDSEGTSTKTTYISDVEAFAASDLMEDGFSNRGDQVNWRVSYVCESDKTDVVSGEHVAKFTLHKEGRIGGHLDLLGRRDGRVVRLDGSVLMLAAWADGRVRCRRWKGSGRRRRWK